MRKWNEKNSNALAEKGLKNRPHVGPMRRRSEYGKRRRAAVTIIRTLRARVLQEYDKNAEKGNWEGYITNDPFRSRVGSTRLSGEKNVDRTKRGKSGSDRGMTKQASESGKTHWIRARLQERIGGKGQKGRTFPRAHGNESNGSFAGNLEAIRAKGEKKEEAFGGPCEEERPSGGSSGRKKSNRGGEKKKSGGGEGPLFSIGKKTGSKKEERKRTGR